MKRLAVFTLCASILFSSCPDSNNKSAPSPLIDEFATRQATIDTLKELKKSADGQHGVYYMDVKYDYDVNEIINASKRDDITCYNKIVKYATNGKYTAFDVIPRDYYMNIRPFFCSTFSKTLKESNKIMHGRNYDYQDNDSIIIVHNKPKGAYESISVVPLYFIFMKNPMESVKNKTVSLVAPFASIDGVNEKGVSICTLQVSSASLYQNRGKKVLYLPMVIRLVLDNASTTQEAVDLINEYDVFGAFASLGEKMDYHFFITDASGDSRVVEFDPDKSKLQYNDKSGMWEGERETTITSTEYCTNFYIMPNAKNPEASELDDIGDYYDGGGLFRYRKMESMFENAKDNITKELGWSVLEATRQPEEFPGEEAEPSAEDDESDEPSAEEEGEVNTIYSWIYDHTDGTFTLQYSWDEGSDTARLVFKNFVLEENAD